MRTIKRIPLDHIRTDSNLKFLAVEFPLEEDRYIPFATIHYSIDNQIQPDVMRLDLDKRCIIYDRGFNAPQIATIDVTLPKIIDLVSKEHRRQLYFQLKEEFEK